MTIYASILPLQLTSPLQLMFQGRAPLYLLRVPLDGRKRGPRHFAPPVFGKSQSIGKELRLNPRFGVKNLIYVCQKMCCRVITASGPKTSVCGQGKPHALMM